MLARFSETFSDYALMLYSYTNNKDVADAQLIDNKISFLQSFPVLSRDRARSFNYKDPALVCSNENTAGLVKRIQLLLGYGQLSSAAEKIYVVEHVLLRPRNFPDASTAFPDGDPLLTVCLNAECSDCDERDPYSFRMTIVLNGEDGLANKGIEFRRFAEQTIRMETPAHIGLKVCWVSQKDLEEFGALYCNWLSELAKPQPDDVTLHNRLVDLLKVFTDLNNVYPQATLHDCVDGNDDNRVFLGSTAIISDKELDIQIKKKKEEN